MYLSSSIKRLWIPPAKILSTKCCYPHLLHMPHIWILKLTHIACSAKCTCPHLLKRFTNASHSFLLQQGRYHRSHLTGHSSAQLSSLNCFLLLFVLIFLHSNLWLTPSFLFVMKLYLRSKVFFLISTDKQHLLFVTLSYFVRFMPSWTLNPNYLTLVKIIVI